MLRSFLVLLTCAALAACGGGGGGGGSNNNGGGGTTDPGTSSPPGQARVVTVASGQTASGINIAVPSGAAGLNAEFLGAAEPVGGLCQISGYVNGAMVRRGRTHCVALGGTGITATTQVRISGPNDITLSGFEAVQFDDGNPSTPAIPGILFVANVSAGAVKGARTVMLISGNNMAAFSGGLEVVD